MSRCNVKPPVVAKQVLFDGQSRLTLPASPNRYPDLLMAGRGVPYRVVAVDGHGWSLLAPTAMERLYPWRARATESILVMTGGESDLWLYSAAVVYANACAYADAARAMGFGPIIATTVNGGALAWWSAPNDAKRIAYNALLLADDNGAFDVKVDLDVSSLAYASHPEHYADGLHYDLSGSTEAAALMDSTMDTVLA